MSIGDLTGFRRQEEAIAANRIDDAIKRKMRYEDLNRALKGRIISIVQSDPEYYKRLAAETDDNVLDLIISGGALGGKDLAKFMSVRQQPLKFGSPETAYSSMSSKITPYSSEDPQSRIMKFADAVIGKATTQAQTDIEKEQSRITGSENPVKELIDESKLDKMVKDPGQMMSEARKNQRGFTVSENTKLDVTPGKPTLVQTMTQESNPYFEGVEDRNYKDLEKLSSLEESNKILTGVTGGGNVYDDARKQRIVDFANYVSTINRPKIVEEQKVVQQGTEGKISYTKNPLLSETAQTQNITKVNIGGGGGGGGLQTTKLSFWNPEDKKRRVTLPLTKDTFQFTVPGELPVSKGRGAIKTSGLHRQIAQESKWVNYNGKQVYIHKGKVTPAGVDYYTDYMKKNGYDVTFDWDSQKFINNTDGSVLKLNASESKDGKWRMDPTLLVRPGMYATMVQDMYGAESTTEGNSDEVK